MGCSRKVLLALINRQWCLDQGRGRNLFQISLHTLCRSPFDAAGCRRKVRTLASKISQLCLQFFYVKRILPTPLRLADKFRPDAGAFVMGIGDVTLRRELKASGLASLCPNSLSSVDKFLWSLFARKLSIAESRVDCC